MEGSLPRPPEGTVALLFTDIEGSTRLAARLGGVWPGVLEDHHGLVGRAIAGEGGFVDGTEGDAFFATFVDAAAGARAAVAALRALRAHGWPVEVGELAVRMGLHVGYVERRSTGYVGLEIHRAARIAAAARGGQLLLSAAARALIGDVFATEPLGLHRLKDFPSPEPLFCAVVDGRGASAFPPPGTEEFRATNLPAGRRRLVGREGELERVRRAFLVEGERLVTLTGRGGVGKTSLALMAATGLLDEHPGGVWLVRLATATEPDDVMPAVAAAIGSEGDIYASPLEAVVARLRGRGPVLLVLDNLEHLVSIAPVLGVLLDALPDVRMLVTSQVPLRLESERCLPLDALDSDAALALIERVVRQRGATISTRATDRQALVDVVRLVDGLPLGLELAAARLGLLSAEQLRDRISESTDLLTDRSAERPGRQRSLRATVEWTLGLLENGPRKLFVRMGAFASAAPLEHLEAVAGGDGLDVLEALSRLLDVALVRRVESGDGRVRFGLPEALRQIAARLLDSAPDGQRWRRTHAEHQRELTWAARTLIVSGPVFREAVEADVEAAAALRWAQAVDEPLARSLGVARAMLLVDTGRVREAMNLIEPLVARRSANAAADSLAFAAQAIALAVNNRMPEAIESADRSVEIAADADPESRAFALIERGVVQVYRGRAKAAVPDHEQATALARHLGPAALAGALSYEAQARIFAGEFERAAEQLEQVQRIGTPADAKAIWHIDTLLGDLAAQSGQPQAALAHYVRSLGAAEARGDQLQIFHDLLSVADALALTGDDAGALEVIGLSEGQSEDVRGFAGDTTEVLPGGDSIKAATKRLGPMPAAELRARGRAVPAGERVMAACRLARTHQATTNT